MATITEKVVCEWKYKGRQYMRLKVDLDLTLDLIRFEGALAKCGYETYEEGDEENLIEAYIQETDEETGEHTGTVIVNCREIIHSSPLATVNFVEDTCNGIKIQVV